MTDAPPPPISTERASVVGTAGKWLSLFGVLIATGQAGTAWLHGYWQAEGEKQKAAQELALAELKDKSELAQQYLKVILDKDTKPADRALLLTALGDIEGHPLQKWAQEQYQHTNQISIACCLRPRTKAMLNSKGTAPQTRSRS